MKSDFFRGIKLKNEIINKQLINDRNSNLNKNFNNESYVIDLINKPSENYSINEQDMKKILSKLKEKKKFNHF